MRTELANRARRHLADGDIEACFSTLAEAIKGTGHASAYQNVLTLISSGYAEYRRKAAIGTLAGTEASVESARINERIVQLIQDVAEERPPAEAQKQTADKRKYLGLVGALAVAGLAVAFWFFQRNQVPCPEFTTDTHWKIGIVPLVNLGDRVAKPEQVIAKAINELTAKNGFSAQALVWDVKPDSDKTGNQKRLAECGTDLLITGEFVVLGSDSIQVSLNYQFNDARPPVSTEFAGFRNITALREGILNQRSVNDAIFSLCTLLAMRENNAALAEKWLKKIGAPKDWEVDMLGEMKK